MKSYLDPLYFISGHQTAQSSLGLWSLPKWWEFLVSSLIPRAMGKQNHFSMWPREYWEKSQEWWVWLIPYILDHQTPLHGFCPRTYCIERLRPSCPLEITYYHLKATIERLHSWQRTSYKTSVMIGQLKTLQEILNLFHQLKRTKSDVNHLHDLLRWSFKREMFLSNREGRMRHEPIETWTYHWW